MWADEARAIAGPDQAPLVRAQQAASLAGVGRAVYDALLERIVEADDKRETSTRLRDHLAAVVEEHGSVAAKLDVDALEADIGQGARAKPAPSQAASTGSGPAAPPSSLATPPELKPLSDDDKAQAKTLMARDGRNAVIAHLKANGYDTSGL